MRCSFCEVPETGLDCAIALAHSVTNIWLRASSKRQCIQLKPSNPWVPTSRCEGETGENFHEALNEVGTFFVQEVIQVFV